MYACMHCAPGAMNNQVFLWTFLCLTCKFPFTHLFFIYITPCHFVLIYFSYTLCPVILYSFIFHIHYALSFCTHLFFIYIMPCHFVLIYFSYTLCPVILYSFIFHIHDALSFCTHLFFIYMMPCHFVLIYFSYT